MVRFQLVDRSIMEQNSIIADRILNDMTDGVMTVDLEGRIITFNAAASQILGIPVEEAASRRFGEVFLELEGADEFSQALLDAVYESTTSHNRTVPFSNNGKNSTLALTTTFLKAEDGTGERIGVIAVFSDITEIQELQEAQTRHAEELKAKHRELQDAYLKTEQGNQQLQAALKKVQVIRITATAFTILLFLGIGLYLWNRNHSSLSTSGASAPPAPAGAATTVTVTAQKISSSISLTGKLQPLQMVNIASPLSGKVDRVMVRYGDVVKVGQPLIEMDISEARMKQREAKSAYIKAVANYKQVEKWEVGTEVARANRSLAKAKLALENQKKALDESERLFKKGIIPASENESARMQYTNQKMDFQSAEEEVQAAIDKGNPANLKMARYEMENAETRLKQVEHDISSAVVLAPVSGIVMKPVASGGQVKEGRAAERGGSFQQGEVLMAIGDLSGYSINGKVDEVDVTRVSNGQKVRVTGDAFPGEQLSGVIQSISPQAEAGEGGQSATSFGVRVVIDTVPPEIKKRIMVGMTANLDLIVYEKADALMVPLSAVNMDQGKRFVFRKNGSGAAEKIEVTTGYTTQDSVEIVKGVKAGDVIEVAGMPGMPGNGATPGNDEKK